MYPGPASGVTPIFSPSPPSGQVTGATTGDPLMPSPTSGSSPASMRPIFTGQPSRNATEEHFAAAHFKPPVAHVPGSEEQPLALMAYTRLLPNSSSPLSPSTPSEVVLTP